MRSVMRSGMECDTETGTRATSRRDRCPLGFSEMQIAILSVLKTHPHVIAHWQIAERVTCAFGLEATEGQVRGALERLFPHGFLVRSRAARGRAQGNRYAFSADPCPHIAPFSRNMEPDTALVMASAARSDENTTPSILEEKRDRESVCNNGASSYHLQQEMHCFRIHMLDRRHGRQLIVWLGSVSWQVPFQVSSVVKNPPLISLIGKLACFFRRWPFFRNFPPSRKKAEGKASLAARFSSRFFKVNIVPDRKTFYKVIFLNP
jgi:hypothetical protein